jgi:hypothetical protein
MEEREALFFYLVPNTTRELLVHHENMSTMQASKRVVVRVVRTGAWIVVQVGEVVAEPVAGGAPVRAATAQRAGRGHLEAQLRPLVARHGPQREERAPASVRRLQQRHGRAPRPARPAPDHAAPRRQLLLDVRDVAPAPVPPANTPTCHSAPFRHKYTPVSLISYNNDIIRNRMKYDSFFLYSFFELLFCLMSLLE